jgi:hypothetical protein
MDGQPLPAGWPAGRAARRHATPRHAAPRGSLPSSRGSARSRRPAVLTRIDFAAGREKIIDHGMGAR